MEMISSGSILSEATVGFRPRHILVSGDGTTGYFVSKAEARAFHLE